MCLLFRSVIVVVQCRGLAVLYNIIIVITCTARWSELDVRRVDLSYRRTRVCTMYGRHAVMCVAKKIIPGMLPEA